MFNHHFFEGVDSQTVYKKFLTDGKNKIALVMDPPFGGKVDVIANTVEKIASDYQQLNKLNSSDLSSIKYSDFLLLICIFKNMFLLVFWIFPYFMEPQIVSANPSFQMMDYKVEYKNHVKFQKGNLSCSFVMTV